MPSAVSILSPLFGAILLGVIAGGFRLFDISDARRFSRFVFMVAMPVAILDFMRQTTPPNLTYAGMIAGYLIAFAATAVAAFWVTRVWRKRTIRESGATVFATTCGNAVFLGLPIALAVPGWGPPFLILMLFEGILVFAVGSALMTWPEDDGGQAKILNALVDAIVRALKNPIVLATLIGLTLALLDVTLPGWIGGPLDLFGGIASPMGLFVLGLYLTILPRTEGRIPTTLLTGLLPLKLVIFPAMAGGLTYLFTRDVILSSTATFFTGMPPAIASIVLASNYQEAEEEVAAIVGIGSLIGLGTTTLMLLTLTQF